MADVRQTTKTRSGRGSLRDTPAAPTGVVATPTSATTILIDWNTPYSSTAKTTAITGWKVYRSTTSGDGFSLRATVTVSQYEDTVIEGVTYYYKVTAVGSTDSAYSAEVFATAQGDYRAPDWTIPDVEGVDANLGQVAKGGSAPLTSLYAVNDGTPYFYISGITALGGSETSGITINSATGDISVSATAPSDIYDVVVDLISDVESDWLSRSTASGVLWAHDFRENWEVDYFRWKSGVENDPDAVTPIFNTQMAATSVRRSTDGVSGGSLEFVIDNGFGNNWLWWRPLSPLRYASGTGAANAAAVADDRGYAASGSTQVFDPYGVSGRKSAGWAWGYVAHPSSAAALGSSLGEAKYARDDIYLQIVMKLDPRSATQEFPADTKVLYFDEHTSDTGDEFVMQTGRNSTYGFTSFSYYTNQGSDHVTVPMLDRTKYSPAVAPANQYRQTDDYATCTVPNWTAGGLTRFNACWSPPNNEWFTIMFRLRPGSKHESIAVPAGNNADGVPYSTFDYDADGFLSAREQFYAKYGDWTAVDIWVHQNGWAGYRKILTAPALFFNWTDEHGWNCLKLTTYTEQLTSGTDVWRRFAQVICSTEMIAAPASYGT